MSEPNLHIKIDMQSILDAAPFGVHLWNRNGEIVHCNQATVNLFKLADKQEFLERFYDFSPEIQPDGRSSKDAGAIYIQKVLGEGAQRFEWTHRSKDGELIPCEITLLPVDHTDGLIAAYIRDLREQKCMMQRLSDAAARFKAVAANYSGVIWSVNRDRIITMFDGQYLKTIGVTSDFLEGKSLEAARQKNRHLDILEHTEKTFSEGPQDWVSQIGGKLFHSRTAPMYDKNGTVTGVMGHTDDMTETLRLQQELEAALEKSEAAARGLKIAQVTTSAMFESNPQINILFDSNFKVVDCNPAAVSFMGFASKEEMLAGFVERMVKSIPAFQPNGQPSVSMAERLIATARTGYAKFDTVIRMGGIERNLSMELKRIPYEGSFAVVGYVFDLTDIRQREAELARAHEKNELQLTKLNAAVKATKIGLWDVVIVDNNPSNPANVFSWSDEFRYMLGYADETDFPNVFESWADRLHPDDKSGAIESIAKHLSDKTGKTPYDAEFRMLKRNGESAYFHATGETIRDKDGNAIRIAGAIMDITETKSILLDTQRQRIEAEAASKAKSSFLSAMSHEIRTPMNAIIGITDIQLQNDALPESVKEALGKIYASSDMLLGIINDILDLSKIEAGKLELSVGKYETASLISDTTQLNMMRIGSKPIEFELSVDENTPAVLLGDELRVKQILNNILSNAFKYTAEGTVKLSVSTKSIEGSDREDMLVFRISDTGQGMTKEQIATLFDEYSRFNTDANRTTEGTGLGMSITRNLVLLMRGEILVESEPMKGSVFTVRLPQAKIGSDVLGRELTENLHEFRSSNNAQMKRVQITREPMPYGSVLIVDDVDTNIYVAKGLLAPYKLRIDSANSGFSAIEKIKKGKQYDIIFMDHMMPGMDGIEATKAIRALGYKQSIVALTANAVVGQADIFLGSGFDDYISKPIDIRQLNAVLNKLIRDKQPVGLHIAVRSNEKVGKEVFPAPAPKPGFSISLRFAEIFSRDAIKSLAALDVVYEKNNFRDADNMRAYLLHVHGMKGALAGIGKTDLADAAAKLELAAREGKVDAIASETPAFLDALRAFVAELAAKF